MTKHQLTSLLYDSHGGQPNWFTASDGKRHFGILQSIQREDGSGQSFNVTILTVAVMAGGKGGRELTFHLRTID